MCEGNAAIPRLLLEGLDIPVRREAIFPSLLV